MTDIQAKKDGPPLPGNSGSTPDKTIGFRGTVDYRDMLQNEARARGIPVQGMLEAAVALYLQLTPRLRGAEPILPAGTPNPLAGLTPEERADAEMYIELLRTGQELTTVKCPKSLRRLVVALITNANIQYEDQYTEAIRRLVIATLDNFATKPPETKKP